MVQGTPLPYLKEVKSLRQFKTDYYSVLVAGYSDHLMHYKLDLSASNSVNIEGHDLVIDKIVQPNTMKVMGDARDANAPSKQLLENIAPDTDGGDCGRQRQLVLEREKVGEVKWSGDENIGW
jgi:hypothetical protein